MKGKWIVLFLILVSVKISFSQNDIMNQGEMITKDVYHEIYIHNTSDEIVQPVALKGKTFKFIVDTGAPLAISKELQSSCKYKVLIKVPVRDAHDRSDTVEIILVDTLRLGNLVFKNVPALVVDFKNSPIGCENVEGLIGSNIVRFLVVQFNLNEGKIVLTDQLEKVNVERKDQSRPVHLDNQSNAFWPVQFENFVTDTAHFDSGMRHVYQMSIYKAKLLSNLINEKPNAVYKGFGISGQGVLGNAPAEEVLMFNL